MRGNIRFARFAGIVALGGAFYTATYITSYPGGAPPYAIIGLLAGTVAGVCACAAPRSVVVLTIAWVLLGFAFTGALIDSGIGFGPGFVVMIVAARRVAHPDAFAFLDERTTDRGKAVDWSWRFEWRKSRSPTAQRERVIVIPETDPVTVIPDADARETRQISSNGVVQAGPPGVIGLLGPPGRRPLSGGFR